MNKNTQISLVKEAIKQCHACSLRGDHAPVPFTGHTSPKIVIIGQGPASKELSTGVPWVGKTGIYLKKLLRQLDFPLHQIAWMNIVCCGDNPKQVHIDACRLHTRRQLDVLDTKFLLVCGAVATNGLLQMPELRVKNLHGIWYRPFNSCWAMTVQHPAAILHTKDSLNRESELLSDLEKFRNGIIYGDLMRPKLHEYCIKCGRMGIYYRHGIPFCKTHVPPTRQPKAAFEQLSLFA